MKYKKYENSDGQNNIFSEILTETIILVCMYLYFIQKIRIVQNFRIVQICNFRKNKTSTIKF
jgi:hypothetical protein